MSDYDDFREDRDFSVKNPEYAPEVPPEVARECLEAWRGGKPWTRIRVLEGDSVGPGATCEGSQGEFGKACSKKIEAVQYSSRFGDPLFFCEEHALKQNDWDNILYWDAYKVPDRPEMSESERKALDKFLNKFGRKHKEPEKEEEFEP